MESPPKNFLSPIRPTVRAVIFRNGELLVQVKKKTGQSPYLTLPGGKQEPGESATDALKRECAEEIGTEITVGPLIHVAEVFKPKEEGMRHQLELLFACDVPDDYLPIVGSHPDPSQIDTVWASPEKEATEFRPAYAHALAERAPLYLGVFDG
ncbi:NUDIX domain-containing protein [Roseibium sp. SCP14]|uniref:NUDIX domain-containing protein n=1 Tax=Roseibium sp. SCP14 TaxID=3141375 RepID=UPI00333DC92E